MKASVVICTCNRVELLIRILSKLMVQTVDLKEFEIIVVDNGSIDNTKEAVLGHGDAIPNLKYVFADAALSIGSVRNIGYRSCSTERILYLDNDCIPRSNWIDSMLKGLEGNKIVAGALISEEDNYFELCHNISVLNAFSPRPPKGPQFFIAGANMGFHRSTLDELKGFQEGRRIAEDMEIGLRARQTGYHIHFCAEAIVSHSPNRVRLLEIFRYPLIHARETIHLRNKYRSLLKSPLALRNSMALVLLSPIIALKKTAEIYFGMPENIKYIRTAPLVFFLKMIWCWGGAMGLVTSSKDKLC